MKKLEEKENLQMAIINRLDLLGFNKFDELYKFVAFQFIMDYIKRIVTDEKYFQYGNYDLTTEKNRLTINIDDLEIELEQISLDENVASVYLYAFNKPIASVKVSKDRIIKNPVIYSISDGSVLEEYSFNDQKRMFSYEYALNGEAKYFGTLVDAQTRIHNKAYFFHTSNKTSNMIKINIPDSSEPIDDIMSIYKVLVLEKEKLLKSEKKKTK